jgi:predicted RNA-binding protein with PIN domain
MELLVDGYNIMWAFKNLNPIARTNFDLARKLLIKLLSAYNRYTEENVILVLDGYKGDFPYNRIVEEDGIDVVITGHGINADRWIMEAISSVNFEGSIVTSDKEIIDYAKSRNVPVITAGTFEKILMEVIKPQQDLLEEIRHLESEYSRRYKARKPIF